MTDPRSLCYRLSIPHTVLTKDKRGEEGWSNRMEFHTNSKQMNIARESSGVLLRIPPELNLLFLLPFASGELCWPWVFPSQNTPVFKAPYAWKQSSSLPIPRGGSVLRISSNKSSAGRHLLVSRSLLPQLLEAVATASRKQCLLSNHFNIFKCKILNIRW